MCQKTLATSAASKNYLYGSTDRDNTNVAAIGRVSGSATVGTAVFEINRFFVSSDVQAMPHPASMAASNLRPTAAASVENDYRGMIT